MLNDKENVGVPPLEEGDPYVIVVSSGGPPSDDDLENTPGGIIKVKFPFELASLSGNAGKVTIIADFINSAEELLFTETFGPLTLSPSGTPIYITVDYNDIPDDALTLIRLKWSMEGSSHQNLLLTVPFSYPASQKEYLKKVKLKYQKKPN
ncbi:hypothetical protein AB9P05_11650 [Roseivirga sp. BDSF3-8]|uniref:hypothetical protein n=1 Tax=Roseivirga sp. BDSF3-8 TaxID=3241598 RepID=UPI003532438E